MFSFPFLSSSQLEYRCDARSSRSHVGLQASLLNYYYFGFFFFFLVDWFVIAKSSPMMNPQVPLDLSVSSYGPSPHFLSLRV